jgi:integrase
METEKYEKEETVMALRWRYGNWYIRIRHGGKDRLLSTGLTSKQEAKTVENSVKAALRSGDFRRLDDLERTLCEQLLSLSGAVIIEPDESSSKRAPTRPETESEKIEQDDLTLWDAVEIMMKSPVVAGSPNCDRHQQVLADHIIPYFGPGRLIKNIWIPEIERYLAHRRSEGAAGSTIGKDRSALSILFRELVKHRRIEANPMEFVGPVDESDGEREVYVSKNDFEAIVARCPHWVQAIVLCLYMTGMRANEALVLTPEHMDLEKRIIRLRKDETKERRGKRVPIHKLLVPVFEELMEGKAPDASLFMSSRHGAARIDSVRKPWKAAIEKLIWEREKTNQEISKNLRHVTVKDLRHVWITNAMRSQVPDIVREAIVGHSLKKKTIEARYITVSDKDLVDAIDRMTFDHGKTDIHIARLALKKKNPTGATAGKNLLSKSKSNRVA